MFPCGWLLNDHRPWTITLLTGVPWQTEHSQPWLEDWDDHPLSSFKFRACMLSSLLRLTMLFSHSTVADCSSFIWKSIAMRCTIFGNNTVFLKRISLDLQRKSCSFKTSYFCHWSCVLKFISSSFLYINSCCKIKLALTSILSHKHTLIHWEHILLAHSTSMLARPSELHHCFIWIKL